MPSKPLTVMVPEPNQDGLCSESCPLLRKGRYERCRLLMHRGGRYDNRSYPGKGCPQHQPKEEGK